MTAVAVSLSASRSTALASVSRAIDSAFRSGTPLASRVPSVRARRAVSILASKRADQRQPEQPAVDPGAALGLLELAADQPDQRREPEQHQPPVALGGFPRPDHQPGQKGQLRLGALEQGRELRHHDGQRTTIDSPAMMSSTSG